MLLIDFIEYVKSDGYNIKSQKDFTLLNKYFNDLDTELKDKISKMCVKYWFNKKIKIINPEELNILAYYVDINFGYDKKIKNDDESVKYITIAGKYDFVYKIYDDDNIRQENIFKLNYYNIVEYLKKYFPNVDISIYFEKPTFIDKELKKPHTTYKHDVIINIKPKSDENNKNIFELVFEYFEKIHNRFIDDDKRISTNLFSDEYYVFDVNTDNMDKFIKETIYSMIQIICACSNDKYELAKILYFNENYKSKNIKKDVEFFNKIVDIKKNNKFNFKKFFDECDAINLETEEEFTDYVEFKKYINEIYDIEIKLDKKNFCDSYIFDKIIMYINKDISQTEIIAKYKDMYMQSIDKLFVATEKILEIIRKQRNKRLQLPDFVKNIQKFHVNNLKL
jgi:hypothetical protein